MFVNRLGDHNLSVDEHATLDDFFNMTRSDLEKVMDTIITEKEIRDILQGGKRLRPLLSQLAFKACTSGTEPVEKYRRCLEGSLCIELAHSASLVHDDIIDKDDMRRGKKAFHITEGISRALITGHKMLTKGFNIALSHGKGIAEVYVDSWHRVLNGEIMEVDFNDSSSKNVSMKSQIFEAYHQIIDLKTAALFSSSCKAGAMEADMVGDILNVFSSFGREIGIAYQLADDLVDLEQGEMIESVILPLLTRLGMKQKVNMLKKQEIKLFFSKNKEKIKEFYIDEIKKHVKNAEEISHSDLIPESHYKTLLSEAPSFIINAMLREINITV